MTRLINPLLAFALAPALVAWACGDEAAPRDTGVETAVQPLALSFIAEDTSTACGDAAGIRVTISRMGETLTCEAQWAPGFVTGPATEGGDVGQHFVADCLFTVAAGTWAVDTVAAIDAAGEPLPCCESTFEPTVEVYHSTTTEIGAQLSCDLIGNGALDIFAVLNRPPVIVDVALTPSKFVPGCLPVQIDVTAVDREGDMIDYGWAVTSVPPGVPADSYSLVGSGAQATFVASVAGTYQITVTVTDVPHGLSTSLSFPLHVTTTDPTCGGDLGCSYTQGYWKNHPDAWPVDSVLVGAETLTKAQALAVFDIPGANDATYPLAHQLIAAKLNMAAGAAGAGIAATVADADAFLTAHPVGSGVSDGTLTGEASALTDALTAFNEGTLSVPHCDD